MRAALRSVACAAALAAAHAGSALESTGEIVFRARGSMAATASFDDEHVVGPFVNMTQMAELEWAGDVNGADVVLHLWKGRLHGSDFTLDFSHEGDRVTVEGLLQGVRVRISMDSKRLSGRFGACSMDMARKRAGLYEGNVGCLRGGSFPVTAKGELELYGEAASIAAPEPQLALALIAVLPR